MDHSFFWDNSTCIIYMHLMSVVNERRTVDLQNDRRVSHDSCLYLSKLALNDEARSSQSVHSVLHTIFVLLVLRIFHPRHSCIAHVDFHNNHNKFSFSM